ncbi:hypothetical protein COCMIDRAFT_39814 [Bipolaris oryzae ATCC 44560]|uniref:Uncharacterized protein n=1 Tax=Bipolaris oryzae ATCC 44560 TaxID=930090 RepID=W6ZF20_COCMI|nr:uncharacterized protein COCMIDRAFT_39814 [Bipolaris oryzae ATCC 44560]EUC42106.1 hypothetical protein COCMIDRAFT_39814 [Bipolaris oryzae ATCC 44560]
MPMVAMFILFDFVVENPLHAETRGNLSYFNIVAAHYARLDLLVQGTIHDARSLTGDPANTASNTSSVNGPSVHREPLDDSSLEVEHPDFMSQFDFQQLSATRANNMMNEMDECGISLAGTSYLDFPGTSSLLYMSMPAPDYGIARFFRDSLGWIPDGNLES